MKKIIIFIPSIERAGVEKNLFIISNYLSQKFERIYLVTANNNFKKKISSKIKIICPSTNFFNNKSRFLKSFYCFFKIFFFIKEKNFILLAFQSSLIAAIISKIYDINLIIRLNTSPNKYINSPLREYIFSKVYHCASAIIVNSKEFKFLLKKKLNVSSEFIYNPIVDKISNSKLKSKKIKKLKILNIGRLTDQKDQITLLKALVLLKESKIPFNANIIGGGKKFVCLEDFINKNQLKNNVKLLGFKKNSTKFMKKANIFVLSSKFEGLPNVLIEAQQNNIPIISSNCPSGPNEILLNGKLGKLFPVENYKKLFLELKDFYLRPKNLNKKAKLAKMFLFRFNKKENCKKYFEIIKRFI
tara:strand:- start:106 stop:1179 length:1074 start_codon:yes stop_codon:yes gene_type:complete